MKKVTHNIQRVGLFLLFLIFITPQIIGQIEKYSRVKIHFDNGKNIQQLAALGMEVDHGQHKKGHFFVSEFSSTEIALLQKNKFHIEVLSKDVVAEFLEKNKDFQNAPNRGEITGGCSPGKVIPQPINFSLGSMGGYFTYQEYLSQLDKMAQLYPKIISIKSSIGQSIEGQPIYNVKISDHPTSDDQDPEVLYTAVHHAREPGGLSQLLFYMWYLLENYEKDPLVKSVVDNTQMYFVPCVNPDGYLFNQTTNPDGGGMWRKNRKKNATNNYGVDLNRNYGYKWGYDNNGSSSTTNNETYRGNGPFSEPETQAIKKLCEQHKFQLALNYHTYGNLLIYPWGYSSQVKTVDDTVFYNFGKLFTKENNYKYGNSIETVSYDVNGGSDDWMYGETGTKNKIYSFTPEVGDFADGFWPPSSKIIRMCRENILQNLRLALIAGGLSQTTLENIPNIATIDGYLPFTFQKFGLNNTSDYTIAFEPIQNITFNQSSRVIPSPTLLKRYKDSITYNIPSTTKNGDTIIFVIRTFSNKFETVDTITKIYGRPITICSENGNSFENWTSETWNTTSSTFVSKSQSITDSPNGNYNDNSTSIINYIPTIDLTSIQHAFLEFNAKWDIELEYDYAQLQISEDNGISWKAICGTYTHRAKVIEIYDQPVYNGTQKEWVKEAINLKDYIGKKIKVRFVLKSDSYTNYDGFYFDDFKINTFNNCVYSTKVVACKSYTWNNTKYTKSGTYMYQPKNGGICDTTWYIDLTILPKTIISKNVNGDTLMASITNGNYKWIDCITNKTYHNTNDTSFFVPKICGNYKLIHTSNQCVDTSNCLNFTLETIRNKIVACKEYTWKNKITYTKSGTYVYQPINGGTCDTTWYLDLTILPKIIISKNVSDDTLIASITNGNYKWIDCITNKIYHNTNDTSFFVPKICGNYKLIHTLNQCVDTSNCLNFTLETIRNKIVACKEYTWKNKTTYTKSGTYVYQPKSNGTCDTTWYLDLTILPKIIISKNVSGDTLMASITNGNYKWINCNTDSIHYITTDTSYFLPKKSGNYQLIHSLDQCMDTSNCVNLTLANVYSNLQSIDYKISIYPNPFKEEVTISFDAPKGNKIEIELINTLGMNISTLFSGTLTQNSHQLKLEKSSFNLNPGVYFIRFNVNDQHILRKLLLIE